MNLWEKPKFEEGEMVYVKATVQKAPHADQKLYRVVTEGEGSVVWCTEGELEGREGK